MSRNAIDPSFSSSAVYVLVDGVKKGAELCNMFMSDTDMAIVNISIPPLKRVGCVI